MTNQSGQQTYTAVSQGCEGSSSVESFPPVSWVLNHWRITMILLGLRGRLQTILSLLILSFALPAWAAGPDVDAILTSGNFSDGVTKLETFLKEQPKDDNARLGLAAVQFVQTFEQLAQKLTPFEVQTRGIRELREVFPETPAPAERLSYPLLRKFILQWLDDLKQVETTLALITKDDVKLSLHVARIPVRATTGQSVNGLTLMPLIRTFQLAPAGREADFVINFDRADVDWLRGYCHLLSAISEIGLAYDGQGLFDVIAHRAFKHVVTPHEFLLEANRNPEQSWLNWEEISDWIAGIHMLRFPLVEPLRMEAALKHFELALLHSRQMWKKALAETDNDHEWIPNPLQTGAIQISVTNDMVANWLRAVDEMEAILQGKKLLPFWRGKLTRGVNLRRVFLEPRQLDLVLWIQGTAATPYLEEGDLTRPDTWQRFNQAFDGRFLGFGLWFN